MESSFLLVALAGGNFAINGAIKFVNLAANNQFKSKCGHGNVIVK
jgi:hypothetical protein